jgi:hypothetical protein
MDKQIIEEIKLLYSKVINCKQAMKTAEVVSIALYEYQEATKELANKVIELFNLSTGMNVTYDEAKSGFDSEEEFIENIMNEAAKL